MILNTGSRTDIPAFYSTWLRNRVAEGYCLARNPYYPQQVLRYEISPEVVDAIVFCTKNPAPMLPHLGELSAFRQIWYVTITPYGRDLEPFVPAGEAVMESFRRLSSHVGASRMIWRYDPILTDGTYTVSRHLSDFERMAATLEGSTHRVVISFLDLYEKTRRNFPEAREVSLKDRHILAKEIAEISRAHGMKVHTCLEGEAYGVYGIDTGGCMTRQVIEEALGEDLIVPSGVTPAREGCRCLLGADIGAYSCCRHLCRYCYANEDKETVLRNASLHDPASPLLIGHLLPGDVVRPARQEKWTTGQLRFF